MVRNYQPKTDRGRVDGTLMERAVEEVAKGMSVREVSRLLHVNRITLSRYVKKSQAGQVEGTKDYAPRYNMRQVFTDEEEDGLAEYIMTCSQMFHGLSLAAVRQLAFEYAMKKNKTCPDSWQHNCMAGKDWMSGFMKRHCKISLRSPEATSMARAQGFNKKSVGEFFDLWSKVQAEKKFGPESIFNLDETGITTVQNIPKVLSTRGQKQVGQITAAERGSLVTVCCCVNAVGRNLPPAMIFPRVHFKEFMTKGAPSGTLGLAAQSGWMNSDLFPLVLQHFIKHIGCSTDKPAILFIDNHESHLCLEVIEMARKHGLTIITFPPHTSHKLQPLDVSVYGPLKTHYKQAVNDWNLSNPGKRITIYDLPECFTKAYHRSLSMENISAGFKKTGVWPIDTQIFSDDDFLAASMFMCRPNLDSQGNNEDMGDVMDPQGDVNVPTSSTASVMNTNQDSCPGTILDHQASFEEWTAVRPLPKRKPSILSPKQACKRKVVKAKIITSTPEKEEAAKKREEKLQKLQKPKKRLVIEDESSDDQLESISIHGESSEYEEDFGDDQTEEQASKEPEEEDFVLIRFKPENSKNKLVFYIGQINEIFKEDGETCYDVDFYRQSQKCPGKFIKPPCEDRAKVMKNDIVMCLPKPIATGGSLTLMFTMEKPFVCDVCGEGFSSKDHFDRHMKKHTGKKPFSCDLCRKNFSLQSSLFRHMKTHSGEKPFSCDLCGESFNRNNNLNRHMKTHSGEKPFSCDLCGKSFSHKSSLVGHMQTHSGEKPFSCDLCKKSFSLKKILVEHMKTHSGKKPFSCDLCKKSFICKKSLVGHMKAHTGEKPFSCDLCGKCVGLKSSLVDHMKTHTKEKPFSCDLCEKGFSLKKSFVEHMKTHTGDKPFSCDLCGKSFDRKGNFNSHMKTHTGERPFSCDLCGKCFSLKSTLVRHVKIHTGQKPFTCNICRKSFFNKGYFDVHKRKHAETQTGERPCNIKESGSKFGSDGHLDSQLIAHTSEKPSSHNELKKGFKRSQLGLHNKTHVSTEEEVYLCHLCERTFTERNDLYLHVKSHSGSSTVETRNWPIGEAENDIADIKEVDLDVMKREIEMSEVYESDIDPLKTEVDIPKVFESDLKREIEMSEVYVSNINPLKTEVFESDEELV